MTDQPELEALLRAIFPRANAERLTSTADRYMTGFGSMRISAPEVWRIVAHIRADKAAAYELGHSVGQHDATTGEDVRSAEVAALERAAQYHDKQAADLRQRQKTDPAPPPTSEIHEHLREAKRIRSLISPTSSTAYAEAIAAAEERGRNAGLAQGRRWRHKKRGSTYTEIGLGEMQCSEGEPFSDYELVMVYRCEADGKIWVRRKSEFEDGRFEEIDPPQGAKEPQS